MPKASKTSRLNRLARRAAASAPIPVTTTTPTKEVESTKNNTATLTTTATTVTTSKILPSTTEKNDTNDATTTATTMSRGQRKRMAKREQYLRREKLVLASLKLKSQEEQKRRIDGLDAIKEALMNTTKMDSSSSDNNNAINTNEQQKYTSNKAKKTLVAQELEHMSLVMQHPAFQANPFETMQEHLRNTFANDKKRMEQQAKERAIQEKLDAEQRVQEKKERLLGVKNINKKPKKKFKNRTRS